MESTNNIIDLEETLENKPSDTDNEMATVNSDVEESAQDVIPDEESKPYVISEDDPLDQTTDMQIGKLMKQVGDMVKVMESTWTASKAEFSLKDSHMKLLHQYNEEHKIPMPENLTEQETDEWDHFNGLNGITQEEVETIFGEGHPIIGVMITQTIDRIKSVVADFFAWMSSVKEYRQIHDAYISLVQTQEDKNIEMLKSIMEKEEDPDKKAKMQSSIESYYCQKYLGFLAKPIDPQKMDKTIKALSNAQKVEYWFNRSRTKMGQIKVSPKFLLEISKFEKRFLPDKYHCCSNVLLLYFMQSLIYCDLYDKKSIARTQVVSMVFALDGIVRQTWPDEIKETILQNIMKFEDQFIDKVPRKTEEE